MAVGRFGLAQKGVALAGGDVFAGAVGGVEPDAGGGRGKSPLPQRGKSRHSLLVNFSVLPVMLTVTLSGPTQYGVAPLVRIRSPE